MFFEWFFIYLIVVSILAFILSLLPLLDDPFHMGDKVCFWAWLYRELYEVLNGEQ